jgi:hypothetical protein
MSIRKQMEIDTILTLLEPWILPGLRMICHTSGSSDVKQRIIWSDFHPTHTSPSQPHSLYLSLLAMQLYFDPDECPESKDHVKRNSDTIRTLIATDNDSKTGLMCPHAYEMYILDRTAYPKPYFYTSLGCRISAVTYDVLRLAIRHVRCTQIELQVQDEGQAPAIVIYQDACRGVLFCQSKSNLAGV